MHKHAKIIMEWAQMMQLPESEWRRMEVRMLDGKWLDLEIGETPAFIDVNEYRFTPRTIRIGDYDVPEPVRKPLKRGANYFTTRFDIDSKIIESQWTNHPADYFRLDSGLIHLKRESAITHAKALLSLTQKRE